MPVEKATTISGLDASWPLPTDDVSQGDDHLRNFKGTMKTQFRGAAGNGYAIPIDATEDDLNHCTGISSNVQDQLDALGVRVDGTDEVLGAPIGTLLLFYSAAVPAGWETVHHGQDYLIRVIDPDIHPEGGGGFDDPIEYNGTHTHKLVVGSTPIVAAGTAVYVPASDTTMSGGNGWQPRYVSAVIGQRV